MRFIVPSEAVSWVDYPEDSAFPIQNIPFGAYWSEVLNCPRPCTAIGEYGIDLLLLANAGLIEYPDSDSNTANLDGLLVAGSDAISLLRKRLFELLEEDNPELQDDHELQAAAFFELDQSQMVLPFTVKAFVDFYSGIHHASNVGKMFRPDQPPLLPNYRWIPIGYNGRASSVLVSGSDVVRPSGQTKGANDEAPIFGPTKEMDFELEMGFVTCSENPLGQSIAIQDAENSMAGLVIVNDWSARDLQRWEYQPLGPFLAKSFATTISPWLVTLDALEPFRIEGMMQDPEPLANLKTSGKPHFDVQLEVYIQTASSSKPQRICQSNMKNLYWSPSQQLTHQSSNGTNVQVGDLYASGTISGESEDSFGSILELSWRGNNPISIRETGETRTFIEDGDTVIMRAYCQGNGFQIGFGESVGRIVASSP
jgi:fumarylacetoacetase